MHNFMKHELIMGTTHCDKWIARGKIQHGIAQLLSKSKY